MLKNHQNCTHACTLGHYVLLDAHIARALIPMHSFSPPDCPEPHTHATDTSMFAHHSTLASCCLCKSLCCECAIYVRSWFDTVPQCITRVQSSALTYPCLCPLSETFLSPPLSSPAPHFPSAPHVPCLLRCARPSSAPLWAAGHATSASWPP